MTTFVRVLMENGQKATVSEDIASMAGYKPLDEPAVDQYGKPLDPTSPDPDAPTGYHALSVSDLKAEIDRRNDGREGSDPLSKTGNKAELIAVLESDDTSNPAGS